MADLLSPHGALRLHGTGYAAYRGGRQSMNRSSVGREMAFVVSRGRPRNGRVQVTGQLQAWKVERLLAGRFVPARLSAQFPTRGSTVILGEGIEASTEHLYRFTDVHPEWISSAGMPRFVAGLEVALCRDHLEEFAVLLNLITAGDSGGVTRAQGIRYQRRLLTCLRKYAHRKYRDPFEKSVARLRNEIRASPGVFPIVEAGLEPIVEQAEARFRIASGADSL
jgi:adenine-specific DNA-methyltransferase